VWNKSRKKRGQKQTNCNHHYKCYGKIPCYAFSYRPDAPSHKAYADNVTADDLVRESGYIKTDLRKLRQLAIDMDIPQSAEELIAQLRP
jgi:hypothetical protein